MHTGSVRARFEKDGYLNAVEIIDEPGAGWHRAALEAAEKKIGAIHYKPKIHTVLRSPYELATSSKVLDVVEELIGPDILLHNVTYIIKEPHTDAHVSWHQDLTYWGLSGDDQVTMWLALSPATELSGCMQMIPGSHRQGGMDHQETEDHSNVLFLGQTVSGIDESQAVTCPLRPGEASFHHGWTLHASMPNRSDDRRIGLNVQYIATHMRQTKDDADTAMLVRGEDRYHHFGVDLPPAVDLDRAALQRQAELEERYRKVAGTS